MFHLRRIVFLAAVIFVVAMAGWMVVTRSSANVLPAVGPGLASPPVSSPSFAGKAMPAAETSSPPPPILFPLLPDSTAVVAPPSQLSAVKVNDFEVRLSWKDSSGGKSPARIETATNPAFTGSITFTVNAGVTTYSDKSVAPIGDTYYYRVVAFTADGESAPSNVASISIATPQASEPNAPSGLRVAASRPGEIDLAWTNSFTGQAVFQLERAADKDFTVEFVSFMIAGNATTYTDSSALAGATYFYRIAAVNALGASLPSNVITVAVPGHVSAPAAPGNLGASAAISTEVRLSWTNTTTNQSTFRIERATDTSFSSNLVSFTVPAPRPELVTMMKDTGVSGKTAYYYRVFAVNAVGSSPASNVAAVTTP